MGLKDRAEAWLQQRVGGIPIFFLFLYGFFALLTNATAWFGPNFDQYWRPMMVYYTTFIGMHIALTHYANRTQSKKWLDDLQNIKVLESVPAVIVGSLVTALCLYLLYMGLGGGPVKSLGFIWVYLPYVIVAAGTEEFVFRFVMARATFIRFAEKKHRRMFSEIGSAVMFGLFHYGVALTMFGMSWKAAGMILSATVMGYIWTLTVNLKKELKPGKLAIFFGMGFAIGSHITWNIMVTMFGPTLSIVPFIYVLSVGPILVIIPIILLVILCVKRYGTKSGNALRKTTEASVPS
jgi:hypothetical protein